MGNQQKISFAFSATIIRQFVQYIDRTGASILGGLGEQKSYIFKVGVDRLVILTDLLCLDRQIVA